MNLCMDDELLIISLCTRIISKVWYYLYYSICMCVLYIDGTNWNGDKSYIVVEIHVYNMGDSVWSQWRKIQADWLPGNLPSTLNCQPPGKSCTPVILTTAGNGKNMKGRVSAGVYRNCQEMVSPTGLSRAVCICRQKASPVDALPPMACFPGRCNDLYFLVMV